MSNQTTILTAEFPRAVRGYATVAVDDFVRQIGERLDSLQDALNSQVERADGLDTQLDDAIRKINGFREKESAMAGAMVSVEQQKGAVRAELEVERQKTAADSRRCLDLAREEAEAILAHARLEAQEITAAAESNLRQAEEQISTLQSDYGRMTADIRRTLEAFSAKLPESPCGRDLEANVVSMSVTAVVDPGRGLLAEAA